MNITEYRRQMEKDKNELWEQFKKLKETILEHKALVNKALYGKVFEKLAVLMRDMEGDPFAARLEEILLDFGMEEIRPQSGETINFDFHDRTNSRDEGMTITECECRGWKYDGQKLLAAIVRTEEPTQKQTERGHEDEQ